MRHTLPTSVSRAALALAVALACGSARAQAVVHFGDATQTVSAEEIAISRVLETRKVTFDFEEAALEEVVAFIRQVSGLNILLDPGVLDEKGNDLQINLKLTDITLGNALAVLEQIHGLRHVVRHGVLMIESTSKATTELFFKVYDVRDLMFEVRDFPGPDITLTADDGSDIGASIVYDEEESSNPFADPDTLQDLITANVQPESWDEEKITLSLSNGLLLVTNSREAHAELVELLAALRANR